jgi:Ca2+-binding EF-hand superfamily protein
MFKAIERGVYSYPSNADLSDSVRDLIKRLLTKDVNARLTAEQALKHPWITGETAADKVLSDTVVQSLGNFRSECRLKKAVGRMLANRLTDKDKKELKTVFKQFDKNGDGQLGPDEIAAMMKHLGKNEQEAKLFVENADSDKSGQISVDEFAATYATAKLDNEDEAKKTFSLFDKDQDGFVDTTELAHLLNISAQDAKNLVLDVDKNKDGKIELEEWLVAMRDLYAKVLVSCPYLFASSPFLFLSRLLRPPYSTVCLP